MSLIISYFLHQDLIIATHSSLSVPLTHLAHIASPSESFGLLSIDFQQLRLSLKSLFGFYRSHFRISTSSHLSFEATSLVTLFLHPLLRDSSLNHQ
jgi:hypothetical protein